MTSPKVTIIVSPRERFSESVASLASIYSDTSTPFHLIYVDAGSPPAVAADLERMRQKYAFKLIRTDHILTPNEARNLAIPEAKTPWVMFLDNDVIIEDGWLGRLIQTGEQNDAQLVGPLYLHKHNDTTAVHMAGGVAKFYEHEGKRRFHEAHSHFGATVEQARKIVSSGPVELLEFHGMLASKECLDHHGPLDEKLLTVMEHIDLCLATRDAGGKVWLDMDTTITYVMPPPFTSYDLGYFITRWSHDWNVSTLKHFAEKWCLDPDDPYITHEIRWADLHREIALKHLAWPLGRLAGRLKYRTAQNIGTSMVSELERLYSKPFIEQRRLADLPV